MAHATSFRLGVLQRTLPVLLGFLAATVLMQSWWAFRGHPMSSGELGQCVSWALFGTAFLALLTHRRGTLLTDGALVVHDARLRRIPRSEIRHLEVRRTLGVRQVVVYTTDGRRTLLPAPMSFCDGDFDRKAAAVTEWWRAARPVA